MNDIIPQEVKQELQTQGDGLNAKITGLIIADEKGNTEATLLLKSVKEMRIKIEDTFKPAVSSAKKAYDEARALRDTFLKPVENSEALLRQKIGAFVQAENKRLADIAAAEAKEREKEIRRAERKAERTGAPVVLPPTPAPIVTKVSTPAGVSHTVRWSAEVTDIKALCKAVADGKAMPELVLANMPALNKLAQMAKGNLSIPGVKAVSTTSTVIR